MKVWINCFAHTKLKTRLKNALDILITGDYRKDMKMKKLFISILAVMLMTVPGCASSKKTVTKTKEVTKKKTEEKKPMEVQKEKDITLDENQESVSQ